MSRVTPLRFLDSVSALLVRLLLALFVGAVVALLLDDDREDR